MDTDDEFDDEADFDYEEDDDLMGDEAAAEEEAAEEKPEILEPAELLQAKLSAIDEVNSIFQIPAATARQLLAFTGWNKEKLLERYYGGDATALYEESGCIPPDKTATDISETSCEICVADIPPANMLQLPCGHPFCRDCWQKYLEEKISSFGAADIMCPSYGCPVLIDESTVSKLLESKPDVLRRFQYFAAKAFVQHNPCIKWCPNAGCTCALRLQFPSARTVECQCGTEFCFQCGKNDHIPLKCSLLALWLKKCEDDSETSNWIASHTKECPKCSATIEKNGGCNHMTCRSCKYEFCWVCEGAWEPHGSAWFNCNLYKEAKQNPDAAKASDSRASLERYLHYYNRYINHERSRVLETNLLKLVASKQAEMQQADFSWIEVQFLSQAVKSLRHARNVLKNTYVFAFYLEKNNQAAIFEQNQSDLEMATENLSEYLERDATADDLASMKQRVMDLSEYCSKRRDALLAHVAEGYEERWWQFTVQSMQDEMEKP